MASLRLHSPPGEGGRVRLAASWGQVQLGPFVHQASADKGMREERGTRGREGNGGQGGCLLQSLDSWVSLATESDRPHPSPSVVRNQVIEREAGPFLPSTNPEQRWPGKPRRVLPSPSALWADLWAARVTTLPQTKAQTQAHQRNSLI